MAKIEIKKEDLQRLFVEEGKKIIEIAEIYNCSRDTIARRLVSYGLKEGKIKERTKSKRQLDLENTKSYIVEQYKLGRSCKDIGDEIGLSEKTVSYHLRSMGESTRSQKKVNQDDFERLWSEGKSDLEIAEFLECKKVL